MMLSALGILTPVLAFEVSSISVNKLYQIAEVVAIAQVESVTKVNGAHVAHASISKTFKGPNLTEVNFVAEATWTCDSSSAKPGERVLIYLDKMPQTVVGRDYSAVVKHFQSKGSTLYKIAHSGHGKMPLQIDNTIPLSFSQLSATRGKWVLPGATTLPNGKFVQRLNKETGKIDVDNLLKYK